MTNNGKRGGFDPNQVPRKLIIAIIVVSILVFFILGTVIFLNPVASIGYDEVGLKQSKITNKVDTSKVWDTGLHFVGFGNQFVRFKKIYQTVEFTQAKRADDIPLASRTKDGLSVTLDMSFQYRLIPNEVGELYLSFGKFYQRHFVRESRDILRDIAGEYTAIEFFNNRTGIGDAMHNTINQHFQSIHAEVGFFQLRAVDLPDDFEAALEQAEVARQQIVIAQYEQDAARIRAQTSIIEAQAQANITILEANASTEAFLVQIDAEAKAVNITLTAESIAYYALGQQLGLNSTELLSYLWIQAIAEMDNAWVLIGADTPVILNPEDNN